ncbi:MAG: 16S rRNA (cytosine(967)-C(5))-methyltransferase RsmB [Gammaproteobacteria bacterium]|nr:16S rRNA (cytosine(967)-C(5))-methyltransferase RsmB [Gammaproteobacteria bacterium]NIR98382.1 16S rRNA (cytosine(967)-C(5))-methyltransferase RsmB [Gammaproteobacteria bacterium]NIT64136.1 16S rRNA (cytosine(967)-C(5))-methyltransferase RsmB [Gammaproteobacteria bacterium]NIV21073.1 16S rRNA (cytosine(967)-C(5))-methyltransferase RsmB [Gammaproteobacteria bacterium]NIY32716.1 16S rRNA (cytosine(967)-C(5))-methyltransferase RsmB [Gammaproteobacteria bacterium]
MNTRAVAARVVARVVEQGRSLDAALDAARARVPGAERALLHELAYGTLRWHPRLDALARRLLRRPLKPGDRDVHALVLVGLYQLAYLRVPAYAAVAQTVDGARALGKAWAAGLVNGVLRTFQREADALGAAVDRDPAVALAHPPWLLDALWADWPQHWRAVAEANSRRAPMTLRVNLQVLTREAYARALTSAGLACDEVESVASALSLRAPVDVNRLPGFAAGQVSVQDAGAQLAAWLLPVAPGMRVLDACAAPGGKAAHLLERYPRMGELTALDIDEARLQRVGEALQRLGLEARLRVGDAAGPEHWWGGRPYDRILVDAPCTATGVIRRHPDIKVLRRPEDVENLALRQAAILDALWPLLAPGGILLYATCSVLDRENAQQVSRFVQAHPDAREMELDGGWGRACRFGRQILPGDGDMDGFYYARLEKRR